jgi:transposase-like protein
MMMGILCISRELYLKTYNWYANFLESIDKKLEKYNETDNDMYTLYVKRIDINDL